MLIIVALSQAVAEEGAVYAAFISDTDRHNSKGEALTTVEDILRQDRANYHNGKGDRKDEDDGGMFSTKAGRAKFENCVVVFENLKASDVISGRQSSLVVRVIGQRIYVEAVE